MVISVVVPCFNEEESIPLFYEKMERVRTSMGEEFEYIFINDGSSDKTLDVLRELNLLNPCAHYLSFSRNFGKEAALYAGLQHATGCGPTRSARVIDRNEAEVGSTAKFGLRRNPSGNP